MAEVVIRTAGLGLGYGAEPVLHSVDLEIRAGEYWFLVGANGTGKSTFVRALFGLLEPSAGSLWVDPTQAPRERMGFVPQRCALNPSLPTTVRELVLLGLVGLAVGAAESRARLARALHRVGLTERARDDYWALSGGQRQRVLLARALIREPRVLVLDEPEAGLDPTAEASLLGLLARINSTDRAGPASKDRGGPAAEEGVTLLYVTHDLENVRRHATHVALFRDGGVHAGPVADVLTASNLARTFGLVAPGPAEAGT